MFFWGEDAVADGLSPYIDAAPLEEQKYFLDHAAGRRGAPRRLLQALHARGGGIGGDIGGAPEAIKPELTWGFHEGVRPARADVRRAAARPSIPSLAAAVTLYHVVIEATLAQPGQHFITSYLDDRNRSPASARAWRTWSADEQRHIGSA